MDVSASPMLDKTAGPNASDLSTVASNKYFTADVGATNATQEVLAAVTEAMLQARGPCIVGNTAGMGGGGVNWNAGMSGAPLIGKATPANAVFSNALVMLNSAGIGGGGLILSGADGAVVQLNNVTVTNCTAAWGGGMLVEQTAVCLGNTIVANNSAVGIRSYGGGVCVSLETGVLNLADHSAVTANSAQFYGGGIEAEYGAAVNIQDAASVSNNRAQQGGGIAFVNWHGSYSTYADTSLHDNVAAISPDLLLPPTNVSVVSAGNVLYVGKEPDVAQVSSRFARNQGLLPVAVLVSGYQGYPVEGALVSARLNETEELSGGFKKTNASGVADFWDLKLRQKPGLYNVSFQVLDWLITLPPAHLLVQVRSCVPGEVTLGLPDVCEPCVNGSYSFNPTNASCYDCPAGAVCAGATVLPLPGYWHSAQQSPQMHKCPNPTACTGVPPAHHTCNTTPDDFIANTDAATSRSSSSSGGSATCQDSGSTTPLADNTTTPSRVGCADGYTGHLCGECMPGWGMTKLFTCRRCLPSSTIVGLYVSACVVMLLVVKLIAHFTLLENMKASACSGTSGVGASAAALGPADTLKSLILWSQYLTIIASMAVEWPSVISFPLQALQWFWSSASSQTLSLECVLGAVTALPVAIQRVLVYLCTPLLVYVLLVLLSVAARGLGAWAVYCSSLSSCSNSSSCAGQRHTPDGCVCRLCSSRKPAFPLGHVCAVMGLAMVFVFLPTLSRAAFSLFVCIGIDDPQHTPYAVTAAANGSWWVFDLNVHCLVGCHRTWALGLGLPLAIALCFVLPVAIAALTCLNRRRLHDPAFCSKFGFLVSSYKPSRCAWEAVVVLQTNVLVAVAVFGFTLRVYNQALVLNCAFSLIVVLLLVFKPYKCEQLYRLRLVGTGVLLLTSYAALSFLSVSLTGNGRSADAYKAAMGVVCLAANAVYVLWAVALLLQQLHWRPLKQLVRKLSLKQHLLQRRLCNLQRISSQNMNTDIPKTSACCCGLSMSACAGCEGVRVQGSDCFYGCTHADSSTTHHAAAASLNKACHGPALLLGASAAADVSPALGLDAGPARIHAHAPILNVKWNGARQGPPLEMQNGSSNMA